MFKQLASIGMRIANRIMQWMDARDAGNQARMDRLRTEATDVRKDATALNEQTKAAQAGLDAQAHAVEELEQQFFQLKEQESGKKRN